jgi:hypothetical protein
MTKYRCSGEVDVHEDGTASFNGCGHVFEVDAGKCPNCGRTFCGWCCGLWSSEVESCDLHEDCEGEERKAGRILEHPRYESTLSATVANHE